MSTGGAKLVADTPELTADFVERTFFNLSITNIYRAIEGGSISGAYTLLLCSINAIAYLDSVVSSQSGERELCEQCSQPIGQTKDSKMFRTWVNKWLKKINSKTNAHFLYALRNGLVHVCGWSDSLNQYSGYRLGHDEPKFHWSPIAIPEGFPLPPNTSPGYALNLETLLAEYVLAARLFFREVAKDCDNPIKVFNAMKRLMGTLAWDGSNFAYVAAPPSMYLQMHLALSALDRPQEPAIDELVASIHFLYLKSGQCRHLGQQLHPYRFRMRRA